MQKCVAGKSQDEDQFDIQMFEAGEIVVIWSLYINIRHTW